MFVKNRCALKHGDFEYLFRFNNTNDMDKWQTSSDAGYKIGKSSVNFSLSSNNTGLFSGVLSTEFDKPERMKAIYTGYANIQSKTMYRSFYRLKQFDFNNWTHFLIKLRGDGRN